MGVYAVQGMAFGDEGKGHIVNALTSKVGAGLVVRFNGGPQAAHNVNKDGVHHTFSSVGSGTLSGADTFISEHTLVDFELLCEELRVLESKGYFPVVRISNWATVITPYQRWANRINEALRAGNNHGSVGLGIGETRSDKLQYKLGLTVGNLGYAIISEYGKKYCVDIVSKIRDLKIKEIKTKMMSMGLDFDTNMKYLDMLVGISPEYVVDEILVTMKCKLKNVHYHDEWKEVYQMYEKDPIIFEGAQGFLLDEKFGFAPYNTWTDCTFDNVYSMMEEVRNFNFTKIGVFRSYFTRHGKGPFPSEIHNDQRVVLSEVHNKSHEYMGNFRAGYFDLTLARYAVQVTKPNFLAITHLDQFNINPKAGYVCEYEANLSTKNENRTKELMDLSIYGHPQVVNVDILGSSGYPSFLSKLTKELRTPVAFSSFGPHECFVNP